MNWGVIGGSRGMGEWFVRYLKNHFTNQAPNHIGSELERVRFSSEDDASEFQSNEELVEWADVIILSVPIGKTVALLSEIYPLLAGKVLIDLTSVKKMVFDAIFQLRKEFGRVDFDYQSLHPLFGPSIQSVRNETIIWLEEISENGTLPNGKEVRERLRGYFAQDGIKTPVYNYLEHDKTMAIVQSLNHFTLFCGAKTVTKLCREITEVKESASPPYRIFLLFFTRYVLQDPQLYADIQLNNEFTLDVLTLFQKEVNSLLEIIQQRDRESFLSFVQEMQPFFEENRSDVRLSSYLIDQLAERLD